MSVLITGACVGFGHAAGQTTSALTLHTIQDGKLYWIEGAGGNTGIIIGDNGVIVVDAKISVEAGRGIADQVAKLTSKPITHLIETHSDGDHVNGAAALPASVKIVAYVDNRKEQLAEPLFASVEVGGGKCLPPTDRLPNQLIFKDRVTTTIDGEKIEFRHYGPAHTTGDLIVYLPAYKLAFTGDILTFNVLIHPEKHGSLDGWFRTMQGLLDLGATTYIGGHAPQPDTKESLRKRIGDVQASRDKVASLVADGKSLAEAKAAMNDPATDRPGCRGIPYPSLTWTEFQDAADHTWELK
jgi:glyoxylase-like metal-dependent hydrolase (beta-lactamase superfamily II)